MAGYDGYSMSNNAREAYESGEKPMSKWTKTAIMDELDKAYCAGDLPLEALETADGMKASDLKDAVLVYASWHHTSAKYNKTAFYRVEPEKLYTGLGYKRVMFCMTPDGEKSGMWTDRKPSGIGFEHFTADDGTIYDFETTKFARFGYIKK